MAFPTWKRSCAIKIPQGQVYASLLTNFPVLLTAACLPSEMVTLGGANAAQSDGGDIRFSLDPAGKVQLACEVVLWSQNATPASATAEIWVGVTNLRGDQDNYIYVWYKAATTQSQPAANSTYGSQAVWSASYAGVWHVPNGSSLSLADSSASAIVATNHGAAAAAGKIDGAAAFNGTTQYADLGTSSALQISGAITAQGWIKAAVSQPATFPQIVTCGDSSGATGFNLYLQGGGSPTYRAGFILKEGSTSWGSTFAPGNASLNDNAWHFVVGVYSKYSILIFVDGVVQGTGSTSNQAVNYGTTPHGIIGCKFSLDANSFFNGVLDEVRVASTARSLGWIATEYANQSAPSSFAIAQTPFSPGAYGSNGSVRK